MATRGPKIADGVWKEIYPKVFGCSRQVLLNKFLNLSTPLPSIRKWPLGGPKWPKWYCFYGYGRSHHLLINKFFDLSAPSRRKVDDGEENRKNGGGAVE